MEAIISSLESNSMHTTTTTTPPNEPDTFPERERQRAQTLSQIALRSQNLDHLLQTFTNSLTDLDRENRHSNPLEYLTSRSNHMNSVMNLWRKTNNPNENYTHAERQQDRIVAYKFEEMDAREQAAEREMEICELQREVRGLRGLLLSLAEPNNNKRLMIGGDCCSEKRDDDEWGGGGGVVVDGKEEGFVSEREVLDFEEVLWGSCS
ncbi:uncharacterized protein RCC_06419 [Ramularia collo-cygni]|uniref:Uncharacterized protein n=1 Tax=Ramularia collo-cygni TaxID=112498 RepID=A0A2D3UV76_9PEZI|nr:uncharacterized protein RCC_06419 [Ramularia collo-cygni]CZT20561.1 uncharacterized protein RCC_06419 [Ramularia collo-cygni]